MRPKAIADGLNLDDSVVVVVVVVVVVEIYRVLNPLGVRPKAIRAQLVMEVDVEV